MKQNQVNSAFVEMKKEDRYFGEKVKKIRRAGSVKSNKHRVDFRNYSKQDFEKMEDDMI